MLLLVACSDDQSPVEQTPELPSLKAIQALTTRLCECRMAGVDVSAIDKRLKALTDGLDAEGFGTASDPVSYSSVCYPALGKTACTMTEATLVGTPEAFLCTAKQGEEVEAAWNDALDDPYGPTGEADRAARKRVNEMREALRASLSPGDCQ